ncbi:hypothetical protein F4813DRAFT_369769 [Daldinia decipiens]|uniref:uncharacterized protein n=1 Tax=Daldinia decipiens TaxID=326647 RepID=UPI0020C463B3|nr:uncharacterized protein F4813DRAFT_369769 [Daldinia decipiens]KAI1654657.1 hypothetical protein F4813DRAFT_369769 [Daldinia decipiens]
MLSRYYILSCQLFLLIAPTSLQGLVTIFLRSLEYVGPDRSGNAQCQYRRVKTYYGPKSLDSRMRLSCSPFLERPITP